jgi:hypothetical protein
VWPCVPACAASSRFFTGHSELREGRPTKLLGAVSIHRSSLADDSSMPTKKAQAAAPGSSPAETQRSRRAQPRVPVDLAVVVRVGEQELQAVAVNLGVGGIFVAGARCPDYGARIEVRITLPSLPEPSHLPGVVRWCGADKQSFGIQFLELGARETHAISLLVSRASR